MSTFSAQCHLKDHKDKIDVAYSFVTDEVRLIVWEDDDGNSTTTYLSVDETKHIIVLMNQAIKEIEKELHG